MIPVNVPKDYIWNQVPNIYILNIILIIKFVRINITNTFYLFPNTNGNYKYIKIIIKKL